MKNIICSIALVVFLLTGCAAPVQLITPPTEPLDQYKNFMVLTMKNDVIGKINENVTKMIMTSAVERIQNLKYFDAIIVDETMFVDAALLTSGKVIRRSAFTGDTSSVAVMTVTLTDYDEGSALLRFFFAPFAGMGKVGCNISIVSSASQKELIKARTVSSIGGLASGADEVITPIAKALTNVVERFFVLKKKR